MKLLAVILVSAAAALGPASVALAAPVNDNLADAIEISGGEGDFFGDTTGATKETGEPDHAGNPGGRSVWFTWTAPESGTFVFHTSSAAYDTLLAVYTGESVGALTEVASNDDAPGWGSTRSRVTFTATEGTAYAIAVDGFQGKMGRTALGWWTGQAHDLFAQPMVIDGSVGSIASSNDGATLEPLEPQPFGPDTSVWFEWTAPASGTVKFRALDERFMDPVLSVYTGSSLGSLTTVAANDDDPLLGCCDAFVGFEAEAGTVYRIAVAMWGWGAFELSWSPLILGTPGPDVLVGTPGIEEIRGGRGNDVIRGLGGDDVLMGARGNDRIFGGAGNDFLADREGSDLLDGGTGADLLRALDGAADDWLIGGPGRDRCVGNAKDRRRSC